MENELARQDSTTGYSNRDERLMSQLRCSHEWPICIIDFFVTQSIHEFFVYKAQPPSQSVKDRNPKGNQTGTEEHKSLCDDIFGDMSKSSVYSHGNLLNFISNDDYVTEEHQRQLKSGVPPYYFPKYQFTQSDQEEEERRRRSSPERAVELPLLTETSDDFMEFPTNNNLDASFESEQHFVEPLIPQEEEKI